jgi:hypothetical protein
MAVGLVLANWLTVLVPIGLALGAAARLSTRPARGSERPWRTTASADGARQALLQRSAGTLVHQVHVQPSRHNRAGRLIKVSTTLNARDPALANGG